MDDKYTHREEVRILLKRHKCLQLFSLSTLLKLFNTANSKRLTQTARPNGNKLATNKPLLA